MVVKEGLLKLGYEVAAVELGKAELNRNIYDSDLLEIKQFLSNNGFELIDDKKSRIIERIKTVIIDYLHHGKEIPKHINLSDFLSNEIGHDYSYLSSLFSSVEGKTIEKYVILQKIEKVKELLVYDELTLNEIAYQLGYSSVQHLSNQFKRTTGLTPTYFKNIKDSKRTPLDRL
jgi:AraC-like DNA-binding protein